MRTWVYRRPPRPRRQRKLTPTLFTAPPALDNVDLYANADGTIADVVDELDTTTNLYQSVDDDPDSPNDTDWVNNTVDAASVFFHLTDMPADFVSANAAEIVVRYRGQNWSTGTLYLYAQLFESNESSSLSDEELVATVSSAGSFANTSAISFSGLSAGDKNTWDTARLRLRWSDS